MKDTTNLQETTTSTSSTESKTYAKSLLKENYSEANEAEVDQFEWNEIEGTPFRAVGREGAYTLVLGDMAVSGRSFETVGAAMRYVNEKPWELILIASKVYNDLVEFKKNGN